MSYARKPRNCLFIDVVMDLYSIIENFVIELLRAKNTKNMKKTKMEDLEVLSFVLGVYLLALKVSYSVTVLWLALLSLVSAIFSLI